MPKKKKLIQKRTRRRKKRKQKVHTSSFAFSVALPITLVFQYASPESMPIRGIFIKRTYDEGIARLLTGQPDPRMIKRQWSILVFLPESHRGNKLNPPQQGGCTMLEQSHG